MREFKSSSAPGESFVNQISDRGSIPLASTNKKQLLLMQELFFYYSYEILKSAVPHFFRKKVILSAFLVFVFAPKTGVIL